MVKSTRCEAKLLCGSNWHSALLVGSFSGTPEGVIGMLFERLCKESYEDARQLLHKLHVELDKSLED